MFKQTICLLNKPKCSLFPPSQPLISNLSKPLAAVLFLTQNPKHLCLKSIESSLHQTPANTNADANADADDNADADNFQQVETVFLRSDLDCGEKVN